MKALVTVIFATLFAAASLRAADNVVISEFMARNNTSITDEGGAREDWIEVYNAGDTTVNLLNWSLTDTAGNPTKWLFPATNLAPGSFLIVWASNNDRRTSGSPLHTNFRLADGGEYLALVRPDLSVATRFAPTFPPQAPNVSYGVGFNTANFNLLLAGAAARVLVPTDGSLGTNWIDPGFPDTAWSNAVTGVGFDVMPPAALPNVGLVADSVAEFTGTQGSANWFYGFYNRTGDADGVYQPDTDFNMTDPDWSFTGGNWALGAGGDPNANPPWDTIGATSWHPNGINNAAEHWVVRRWVSTVSGPIHIVGSLIHPAASDGTRMHVIVDGVEVGLFAAARSTNEWAVNTTVRPGSRVDFALDAGPIAQDGADSSTVTMKIYQGIIADSAADWTTGGLTVSRGWSYGYFNTNAAAGRAYNYATNLTLFPRQLGNNTTTVANWWDGTQFLHPSNSIQTALSQNFMTPGKTNVTNFPTNNVHWPIRRYTVGAQDAGLLRVFGSVANTNRGGALGDGITYLIFVDGVQVLSRSLNNVSEGYSFLRQVSPGSVIDFVINPRAGGTNDATYLTATLQRVPETIQVVADSIYDWLGNSTQGYNGWTYGYYNKTLDGDATYDANADFTSSNPNWTFTSSVWQLGTNGNATANPPWTTVQQIQMHPNGTNSPFGDPLPQQEHWAIRRWVSEISGPISVNWRAGKQGFGGNGVTCLLLQNGVVRDTILLAGTDFAGSNRVANLTVSVGDKIDLAVTPYGPTGLGDDGSDATQLSAVIWAGCGSPGLAAIADSRNDWSFAGAQGFRGWYYGYYNFSGDTVTPGFQTNDFTGFPRTVGAAFGGINFWTGSVWDWPSGNPPWDFIGLIDTHPNGTNSTSGTFPTPQEHWVMRRWVAHTAGDLRVNWWLAKSPTALGGNGVSGHVFFNGALQDTVTIGGSDYAGAFRTVVIPGVKVGDIIDFAHTPRGPDGGGADSTDGSLFQASIYLAGGVSNIVATDISSRMYNSNATVYLRVPFSVVDPTAIEQLRLRVKYDDGFVAWLNGVEIARRNAPGYAVAATVANSTNDWSATGVQGNNGWFYGYYNKTTAVGAPFAAADFNMTDLNMAFAGGAWGVGPGDPPWTSIGQTTWHPNGSNNGNEHWAVRRWVAAAGGSYVARVTHAKGNTSGNGTTLRVFLNGRPLFTRTIAGNDTAGFTIGLPFTANAGDKLDLALDALGTDFTTNDGSDTSNYGCVIDRVASGDLAWNSAAATSDGTAGLVEEIDITSFRGFLQAGGNVLAIQGLNAAANDPDFYLLPELIGTTITVDTNQIGYFTATSPGRVNGTPTPTLGPIVENVIHTPKVPFTNETILVTAKVTRTLDPVAGATLFYRVMYGSETSIGMFDDGLHGDGAAGDGVWGATIPADIGQSGQMVRWRVVAADSTGDTGRGPVYDNPINSPEYYGTVYQDTNIVSKLPVLHWFVQTPTAANTTAGTRGSIFFKGQFRDNVAANLHGQSSSGFVKKSYDFDLNRNETIKWDDDAPSIDDFNLLTLWADKTGMRNMLAYETYTIDGAPGHFAFAVRVQQNGAFFSVANFVENGDANFLQRLGFDEEGALYKMYSVFDSATANVEKKTRKTEPNNDLQALRNGVLLTDVNARTRFLYDNLNVPEIINFLAVKAVASDHDCCHKNYYFYRDSNVSGEWLALPWDADLTFGHVWNASNNYFDDSIITNTALFIGNNNQLFTLMFANPQMRQMYLRRVRTLMDEALGTNSTPALQDFYSQRIAAHTAQMRDDMALDLAKWGTWNHNAGSTVVPTNITSFDQNVVRLTNVFQPGRRAFLYGSQLAANGGEIPAAQPAEVYVALWGYEVTPTNGNQAQEWLALTNFNNVSVDISGWELDGAVRFTFIAGTVIPPNSVIYVSPSQPQFRARAASPKGNEGLLVTGPYAGQLDARGEALTLTDDHGRLVASNYLSGAGSAAQLYLRVTELNYNPTPGGAFGAQDYEFVELKNVSASASVNLVGVAFTSGVSFTFTAASTVTNLAPGQTVVLVKNQAAFLARYGAVATIAGVYSGSLDNAGERMRLVDGRNEEILDFAYNNTWYPTTDGLGYTLQVADELAAPGRWDEQGNWRPSGQLHGSPGAGPSASADYAVVVSEVLAHTDPPALDYIEFQNLAGTNVDISGWFVSDDFFTPKKFIVPGGTIIPTGGFVTFYETQFNAGPGAFSFSSTDDEAYVFSGDGVNLGGYWHGFSFGASANGVAFGRHVNSVGDEHFVAASARTETATNAYPLVGPVVLGEIMYHPPDSLDLLMGTDNDRDEFIEIHNSGAASVDLFDPLAPANTWRLRGDADYDFPPGVTLAAAERVLVVGFDPLDVAALNMFRMIYNVPPATRVFGPWSGKLDNAAGEVSLQRPDSPNAGSVPYLVVERVDYQDHSPWPRGADGYGLSLQRCVAANYANDPANWAAALPTAGAAKSAAVPPAFTLEPVSLVTTQGSSVTLTAAASGDAPLAWIWRRNGDSIFGATNSSLTLATVAAGDAGEYDVFVYNAAGSALSSNALLQVVIPATILVQPVGTNLIPGIPLNLAVIAIGSGALAYQWSTNGTDIPGANGPAFSVASVQFTDAGNYSVVVSDALRSVTSSVAVVAVANSAGIVLAAQENATTGTYRNTTVPKPFDADTNDVFGTAGYVLYATDVLGNANAGSVPTTNPLTYTDTTRRTRSSLPSWLTLGNNGQGAVATSYGFTAVNEPDQPPGPAVTNVESGLAIRNTVTLGVEGDLVNLTIGANPPPAGIRVGVLIPGGGSGDSMAFMRLRQTGGFGYNNVLAVRAITATLVLIHFDLTNLHAGDVFTLSGAKSASQTGNANLTYAGLFFDELRVPGIIAPPTARTNNEHTTATFTVTARGSGPLQYRWLFNGSTVVADSTNATLTLADVSVANQGNYSVIAYNAAGAATSAAASLTVNDITPPNITCPTNVTVQCDAGVPLPDISGVTATDARDPGPVVTYVGDTSTGTCPKTITRTYKATDASGNMATCAQTITVHDTTPPTIGCPPAVTVTCNSEVPASNFAGGTVSDNCDPAPVVTPVSDVSSGTNPRIITRTYRATDFCGNAVTCVQLITVQDNVPPTITCPVDLTVDADFGTCAKTNASLGVPVVSDNCTATASHNAPSALPVGTNLVTWTATDERGNTAICTQRVVVVDVTPPTITAQPQGRTDNVDSNALFGVTATACTPMTYQWCFGVTVLPDETNATLTVANVQLVNAGGYTVKVTSTGGSVTSAVAVLTVNRPPLALDNGAATIEGRLAMISVGKLLRNDSDPDGDFLMVTGVSATSTNSAPVSLAGGFVFYTPRAGFTGVDRFSYTVSDGRGGTASADVEIFVADGDLPSLNGISIVETENGFRVRFAGVPGRFYQLQRSTNLSDWADVTLLEAPLHGIIEYEDTTNLPAAYYRMTVP